MTSLREFLSLPTGAGPNSRLTGDFDEFGRPIYGTPIGQDYTMRETQPVGAREAITQAAGAFRDDPLAATKNTLRALVQGAWNGVEAPGNALRGIPQTYGDVADTALDWGVMGAVGRAPEGSLRIFAGRNAQTADAGALQRAQDMATSGASRDDIWRDTGWFQGVDGQWRFEIDDSAARMNIGGGTANDPFDLDNAYTVPQVMRHDGLMSAYPDISTIDVYPNAGRGASFGSGDMGPIDLGVGQYGRGYDSRRLMLHELQHGVQSREGFTPGTTPDAFDLRRVDVEAAARRAYEESAGDSALLRELGVSDAPDVPQVPWDELTQRQRLEWYDRGRSNIYHRTAGEVEARNVEARRAFTPEQRRATPPWATMDVPEADQIVRMAAQPPSMSALQNYIRGNR